MENGSPGTPPEHPRQVGTRILRTSWTKLTVARRAVTTHSRRQLGPSGVGSVRKSSRLINEARERVAGTWTAER